MFDGTMVGGFDRSAIAESIAAFIGARLQYPSPQCNSRHPRVSTIKVEQHKSKFGTVRVYCTLADPNEVAAAWRERNDGETQDPGFRERCRIHDARHYRRCYNDMRSIVAPEHRSLLPGAADYVELLHASVDDALKHATCDQGTCEAACVKYAVDDRAALEQFMRSVYR